MADRKPGELPAVTIATNNGDIGGGEVMLLAIAHALEQLDVETTVVGPSEPPGLVRAAQSAGHRTVTLNAGDRPSWLRALRRWDRQERRGVLWCNGLVPATATAGRADRIVHLHQRPTGAQRLLEPVARRGALTTLVPSHSMQTAVRGAEVFPNWVAPMEVKPRDRKGSGVTVLGFLGRPSPDKGVPVLAAALAKLDMSHPGRFRLLLAGEPRFVRESDRQIVERTLGAVDHLVDRPGWMPPADFFGAIDLLVVPSVWPESFGLVAAEAMAARTPVIVSDAGALPEVVGPGAAGIVPAGDADALAAAILAFCDGARDGSVETQYSRWEDKFSPAAGLERVRDLLTRLTLGS